MESGIVGDPLSITGEGAINYNTLSVTYTELFMKHLPFYLSIGMPYDVFWEGDPFIAKDYRRAYDLQRDRINEQLWLQGAYIYQALMAVSPAFRAMGAKPPEKYLEEPLPLTEKEVKERKIKQAKKKQEEIIDHAERFASSFNKQFKERKDDENAGSNDK